MVTLDPLAPLANAPGCSIEVWGADESLPVGSRFRVRVPVGLEPVTVRLRPDGGQDDPGPVPTDPAVSTETESVQGAEKRVSRLREGCPQPPGARSIQSSR